MLFPGEPRDEDDFIGAHALDVINVHKAFSDRRVRRLFVCPLELLPRQVPGSGGFHVRVPVDRRRTRELHVLAELNENRHRGSTVVLGGSPPLAQECSRRRIGSATSSRE